MDYPISIKLGNRNARTVLEADLSARENGIGEIRLLSIGSESRMEFDCYCAGGIEDRRSMMMI